MAHPLVSALMVTQPGRERLAAEAILDFVHQGWPEKELIVVTDSGEDSHLGLLEAALAPAEPEVEVQLVIRPRVHSLGDLRNEAASAALGEYLIQWDDDDRYHRDRVAEQMAPMQDDPSLGSTCLTSQLYYFDDSRKLYWVDWFRRRPKFRSVLIPGTIALRSSVASRISYPSLAKGEDGKYLEAALSVAPSHGVGSEVPGGKAWLYFRRQHGDNTWEPGRFRANALWMGLSADELKAGGRPEILAGAVRGQRYTTPGTVRVMGRDAAAFTIEVPEGP